MPSLVGSAWAAVSVVALGPAASFAAVPVLAASFGAVQVLAASFAGVPVLPALSASPQVPAVALRPPVPDLVPGVSFLAASWAGFGRATWRAPRTCWADYLTVNPPRPPSHPFRLISVTLRLNGRRFRGRLPDNSPAVCPEPRPTRVSVPVRSNAA